MEHRYRADLFPNIRELRTLSDKINFNLKTGVLIYQGHPECTGVVMPDAEIPVFKNFNTNDNIGYAKLSLVDGKVYADLYLNSRFAIPAGGLQAYPALGGWMDGKDKPFVIQTAALCGNPNVDVNIPAITI